MGDLPGNRASSLPRLLASGFAFRVFVAEVCVFLATRVFDVALTAAAATAAVAAGAHAAGAPLTLRIIHTAAIGGANPARGGGREPRTRTR